jgi:hypothetical protein
VNGSPGVKTRKAITGVLANPQLAIRPREVPAGWGRHRSMAAIDPKRTSRPAQPVRAAGLRIKEVQVLQQTHLLQSHA